MKAVILAGGLGTRISEESHLKPKPMIEIGDRPILWHILKIYGFYGINDFIICCGYKGYLIKEYFANYRLHMSDVTFDMKSDQVEVHQNNSEDWRVTLVDTGENTNTGGRLKRVQKYLKNEDCFCFTYGDGVANIEIDKLVKFHKQQGTAATLTSVQPPGRFGSISINQHKITSFKEKPLGDGSWINGGFFVLNQDIFRYIEGDLSVWERDPLERLAADGQLSAYQHTGFWQPMDTLRDKVHLEELWQKNQAPWKVWK
ncbi:MAG: glucose-1-phosphate cytidylyltransferase [Candidatus Wallbacteria bacterium]|nr:glucose-1-phosphate cytidylyltransferase [Candidatus Wallbacteria bacterium]